MKRHNLRNEKFVHIPLSDFHNEDLCKNCFYGTIIRSYVLYLISFLKIKGKQIITSSFLCGLYKKISDRVVLVIKWVRFHAPTAGGTSLIPGQGTKVLHAV